MQPRSEVLDAAVSRDTAVLRCEHPTRRLGDLLAVAACLIAPVSVRFHRRLVS